jgi:hypothetical protein
MKNNPFKIAFGVIISFLILMGAIGVRPGPSSSSNATLNTISGTLPISKISATGTASASTYLRGDGAWTAVSSGPTTYDGSLVSAAAIAQVTGLTGRKTYQFTARCVSNAATNRVFFTTNSDSTEVFSDGRQLLNATSYTTTTEALLLSNTIGNGVSFEITGTVSSIYDGTNTHIFAKTVGHFSSGDSLRWVGHKSISGDTDLTSFAVRSNQPNGFKSGCYFKAQDTV